MQLFRSRLLVLLFIVAGVVIPVYELLVPRPQYDLLFSIDGSDLSYDAPDNGSLENSFVIRVTNQKANLISVGRGSDIPQLFVCDVATNNVSEIPLNLELRHFPDVQMIVPEPELASLTISGSNVAPSGYIIHGFDALRGSNSEGERVAIEFDKSYDFGVLRITFPTTIGPTNDDHRKLVRLEDSPYRRCLTQVGSNEAGLAAHFIGWVIP